MESFYSDEAYLYVEKTRGSIIISSVKVFDTYLGLKNHISELRNSGKYSYFLNSYAYKITKGSGGTCNILSYSEMKDIGIR